MLPTESKKYESTYENPGRDYQSFRKKYKKDYEALTTLPDGRLLILGSGSDIGKKGKLSQRTGALICEPRTGEIQTFDLMGFFRQLRAHAEIVGNVKVHARREINIEGLAVRREGNRHVLSFFNRANMTKNSYDTMIEYSLDAWLKALYKGHLQKVSTASKIQPRRIVKLFFGRVRSAGRDFHINLNDALYGRWLGDESFLIPVSAETDYFTKDGTHHDGIVVFSGIALWRRTDDPGNPAASSPKRRAMALRARGLDLVHSRVLLALIPTGRSLSPEIFSQIKGRSLASSTRTLK